MDNTQLPAEVIADIHAKADAYMGTSEDEGAEWGAYVSGATEYATKLHTAQQEIRALKGSIETHKRSYDARSKDYDELDEKFEIAEELLKKFISRHEAGLLPDRGIYNEIKSFLDGKK